ncbi:hypothetical protein NGTWS1803_16840 [Mycolicibacterium cyprinidarum]|nr:hypothetical protein NGTWS1803_16840 [Mycolicibacterium sp. NGTWS1803]
MTNNSTAEARSTDRPVRQLSGMEVAVIGVAATRGRPSTACMAMETYADLICARTPIRTARIALPRGDARTVVSRIAALASPVTAVFVVGLGPADSTTVQRRVADHGGPLVITELDLVTVALAAAATATLRHNGIAPRHGRIVVTDPERAPRLGPILLAASGASVTNWHERDAAAYPLDRVMFDNDVLVDLAGTVAHGAAPGRILTLPSALFEYGALVLPGLLSAIGRCAEPTLTHDMLASCVRALALLTPANQVLPDLNQRLLIPAVARQVARTLINHPLPRVHPKH